MKLKRIAALACALILAFAGAFAESADLAEILGGMTLTEKVGQMFLARCPSSNAHTTAAEYALGGYVMFADAFENRTPETARERIETIQRAAKIPLLIAVDEEGGSVTRVSRYKAYRSEKFAAPRSVYQNDGVFGLMRDAKEKSEFLRSIGINVNLAPVADVSVNRGDFIYARTLGENAQVTAECVAAIVRQMNASGIGCTLKHFPGYGGNRDTHNGFAVDKREYSAFESGDFLPFIAGIREGAGSVMVSHNIVNCMDANRPASLSPEVHRVLREELGFDGVIITDDLNMDAIAEKYTKREAAVLAVEAGNDLLCTGAYAVQIAAVIDAVNEGRIPESRIDESMLRILRWKRTLGLL